MMQICISKDINIIIWLINNPIYLEQETCSSTFVVCLVYYYFYQLLGKGVPQLIYNIN